MKILGSIETGGTKIVCAIGNENGDILKKITIPTTIPNENISQMLEFFKEKDISALGIGSFGPVDTNVNSKDYGKILNTPKLAWKNFNLLNILKANGLNVPIKLVTDVNEAAIGEYSLGAGKGTSSLLYITVGTGVGAGYITNGQLLEGFSSPEMGHILIEQLPDDNYIGCCPYHKNECLEGLASGTAIEDRWKSKAIDLGNNDDVWEMEANYLAKALANYIYILTPEVIVLGGGIMNQQKLFSLIEKKLKVLMNDYMDLNNIKIVAPKLGSQSGIVGGLVIARELLSK